MHASLRALDALCYAPGNTICRVRLDGERQESGDKLCARTRTVLWLANAEHLLYEFACLAAERALAWAAAAGCPEDPRSRAAVVARRAWLRREIISAELDMAAPPAQTASIAARGSIETAACSAARAVVTGPAYLAAADAARNAAWVATWAADDVAVGQAQVQRTNTWGTFNLELETMLLTLAPAEGSTP